MSSKQTGDSGEQIATQYLIKNKYKIIERNWKQRWAEIDIIAKDPNGTLIIVEVKAMNGLLDKNDNCDIFRAEMHFTRAKKERVAQAGLYYANLHPELISDEKGFRIDLIAITMFTNPDDCVVRHHKNV